MSRTGTIFHRGELREFLDHHAKEAASHVYSIPADQFETASDDEMIEHVRTHHEITPIELHDDRKTLEHQRIDIPASQIGSAHFGYLLGDRTFPGIRFTVHVPFSGDSGLWKCSPSKQRLLVVFHEVVIESDSTIGKHLNFVIEVPADDNANSTFERELSQRLERVRIQLGYIRDEVIEYNNHLTSLIRETIIKRRAELRKYANIVQSIAIPLHRNPHSPSVERVPLVPKHIKPLPAAKPQDPEYSLSDSDYEYILKVIRHEGRTYEALRRTFRQFGEEELRDVLLAHLNGHFEGQAKGEAFRGEGKTDILIEFANRAAFIAECKVWEGQKVVPAAFDQLDDYTTWSDLKLALIYFNKNNVSFSGVQKALPEALKAHRNYVREEPNQRPGEWRFIFRSQNDPDRLMTVQVFLFDVFVKNEPAAASEVVAEVKQTKEMAP